MWENNEIQFARLLCEIVAIQDNLDFDGLCESMDLNVADLQDLFDRADDVFERAKGNR